MNSHFHVCTGPVDSLPNSDVLFEQYFESLHCFISLANTLFRDYRETDDDLTIEQAFEATGYGKSRGAFVGPPSLTLYWLRCEDIVHGVPSWN